jgi:glycerol-1-phosphate dehydrogenase [NAD(P)+]
MSIEQPNALPRFRYDPADMDGLRRALASRTDAASLPELNLRRIAAGPDALDTLPAILRDLAAGGSSAVLVVQDRRPFMRDGADLKPLVRDQLERAGFTVEVLEMGDEHGYLHSDFAEVGQIRPYLRPDRTAVALGSGKICDVTKHACFEHEQVTGEHIPFVVIQTANSVIAFGSGMATISKDGVKRTWPSRLPDALILDARILRDTPYEYTVGGIGDLAVIAVSFGDWYLGAYLGMTTYTPASFDIIEDVRKLLFSQADAYGAQTLEGMETLAKLSALGGFAMTLTKESAPMSGYEHAVSHMLDMGSEHFGRPVASHGCQCGISTIACAIAWQKLLADFQPQKVDVDACYPSAEAMERRVRATFNAIDPSGAMADECWHSYGRKLKGWHQARPRFEALLRDWPQERARMAELVDTPENVVQGLAKARHPLRYEDLGIPEWQARWAFKHGHMMRQRFSSADLLNYIGWMDDAFVDDVFTRMRALVDSQVRVG